MAWWRFLLLLSSSLAFRKSDFTDWDCRRVNSKLVLWNTLREVAVAEADAAESSLFTVPNLVSTVSELLGSNNKHFCVHVFFAFWRSSELCFRTEPIFN